MIKLFSHFSAANEFFIQQWLGLVIPIYPNLNNLLKMRNIVTRVLLGNAEKINPNKSNC